MLIILCVSWLCLRNVILLVTGTKSPTTVTSACRNACSQNGYCSKWNTCECFKGFEGNDCSRRSCPTGPALADVAIAKDTAHQNISCSGRGVCNYNTGICKCQDGYSGYNCAKSKCYNDCNGRGKCLSLRQAATDNDGYGLNRTTVYDLWDADIIYGCVCDYGFSGPDCSIRSCEYGVDPRLSELPHEVVKLQCTCINHGCTGKFKLRFYGSVIKTWLYPTSTLKDLIAAVESATGVFKNNTGQFYATVDNGTTLENSFTYPHSVQLCNAGTTTNSTIRFRRNAGHMPALSFYANLISDGSVYFSTDQTIQCNCLNHYCNGTFRLSFDGQISTRIPSYTDGYEILTALQSFQTLSAAGYAVKGFLLPNPLCMTGKINNFTFTLTGNSGNAPLVGIWSSVVDNKSPSYYTTSNTSNVLTLLSHDGRDDHVKLCNGIGYCNATTGTCECPFGWGFDADLGVCGGVVVPTSRWNGLARCPGVVDPGSATSEYKVTLDSRGNYDTRVYISINPVGDNRTHSAIYYFTWRPVTARGPYIDYSTATLFLNLTSNSSAGPIVLDQAKDRLFYIDANPAGSYIGIAPQFSAVAGNFTKWYSYSYKIFSLVMDAYFTRRKLYWSVPGLPGVDDGAIYWAYADQSRPTVYSLVSAIGQKNLFSPHGLAIHYPNRRLYWVDRNTNSSFLVSSKLDGSDYQKNVVFKKVENKTVSVNLTDIAIDFSHNNTALIIDDSNTYSSILAVNLDAPIRFDNSSDPVIAALYEFYYSPREVVNSSQIGVVKRQYLFLDEVNYFVVWSDLKANKVEYARYRAIENDVFSSGVAYRGQIVTENSLFTYQAVAMVLDRGLGQPHFNHVDCYGNGKCLGSASNFACECNEYTYGDCQRRICPKGKAWFMEPAVNNSAHDEYRECSNVGICDPVTGQCTCPAGFEGAACERSSCPKSSSATGSECYGKGRCLSMRQMATYHVDQYLDPDSVLYGSTASDPSTWDADIIHGCVADVYGSLNGTFNISSPTDGDMTRTICPVGYNRRLLDKVYHNYTAHNMTTNYTNHAEIQEIVCDAWQGNFVLSFRGKSTDLIYFDDTAATLKKKLQALPTLGSIAITSNMSHLCSSAYTVYTQITFLSAIGEVPLLQVVSSTLGGRTGSVTITRVQAGEVSSIQECAGRGYCDFSTGDCNCWDGYGTSDGFGNAGTRGDCGHYIYT